MGFGNQILLAGMALVSIPIILHLIMRQQAVHVIFPALRFLQLRKEQNRRSLRFRHLLLLLLRCLALALLAIALARPNILPDLASLSALSSTITAFSMVGLCLLAMVYFGVNHRKAIISLSIVAVISLVAGLVSLLFWLQETKNSILGGQEDPIAVAIVFDNSPRMQYLHDNQTRLKVAQEISIELIGKLPRDSEVAIYDLENSASKNPEDRAAAKRSVKAVLKSFSAQSLSAVVVNAISELNESKLQRREVYVLTDQTQTAWAEAEIAQLKIQLEKSPEVQVYIIDVGVEKPKNLALGQVTLSSQSVAGNGKIDIISQINFRGLEVEGSYVVKLKMKQVEAGSSNLKKEILRGDRVIKSSEGDSQIIQFNLLNLKPGIHQGEIIIDTKDGLSDDNHQYFTIKVRKPWRILIASPKPTERYSADLHQELAPYESRLDKTAKFQCTIISTDEIIKHLDPKLSGVEKFDAVCLVDPKPLDSDTWTSLGAYVAEGGGLAIFLGNNARDGKLWGSGKFNSAAATSVLPAKIKLIWNFSQYIVMDQLSHPVLQEFKEIDGVVPWHLFRVFKYWRLEKPDANNKNNYRTLLKYLDGQDALVERSLGQGKVLMLTTSVYNNKKSPWNLLLKSELDSWPMFVLLQEMMKYLIDDEEQLNYAAGNPVILKTMTKSGNSSLYLPGKKGTDQDVDPNKHQILISKTKSPGNYQLKISGEQPLGFSTNLLEKNLNLDRISEEELRKLIDSKNVSFTKDRKKLTNQLSRTRSGIKLYRWICLGLVICVAFEQILSSFFYRNNTTGQ